jgi:hypothetical protein
VRLLDVNVLVYAHRADSPHHDACRRFLEEEASSPSLFGAPALALSGFLRVTTHPRVFETPTPPHDAMEFVTALTDRPNFMTVYPGTRHWSIFADLLQATHSRGNLVPDAYLAAMAIESGGEWVTTDGDFARFPNLRTMDPRTAH